MANKSNEKRLAKILRQLGQLTLQDVRLTESRTKLGQLREGRLPNEATQSVNLTVGIEKEKKVIYVLAALGVDARYQGDPKESETPLSIHATFALRYGFGETTSRDDEISEAVTHVASLVVWPFWREFVHSTSSRMGLPPFPVPLMNVGKMLRPGKDAPKRVAARKQPKT